VVPILPQDDTAEFASDLPPNSLKRCENPAA